MGFYVCSNWSCTQYDIDSLFWYGKEGWEGKVFRKGKEGLTINKNSLKFTHGVQMKCHDFVLNHVSSVFLGSPLYIPIERRKYFM